jgi:hypothetical protein
MQINGQEVEVEQFKRDWALALMEQGVIVKLTISRWRATSKLKYEELGIAFSDSEHQEFMSKYIELGHEKLLPPSVEKEIQSVEARARRCLGAYSYQTVWGRFVPYSAFSEWRRESDEIKEDFMNLARDIGNRYDDIVKEVKEEYETMGRDVWARLYPNDSEAPASFLENFTSRITDKIPTCDKIVSSFRYETIFFNIPLPSFIQQDIAKAEQVVIDREKAANEALIEMETKRVIAEEYREKKKELIDGFLESTVTFLRHHISELATHTYQVLQRHEKDVNMTHVKKINRMISQVRNLNFYKDEEVEAILNDLEAEVSKYKGERDKVIIQTKLRELVDLAKEEYLPEGFNPIIDIMDIN